MSTHMPGQRRIKTAMTKKVQMRRMRKTRVSENVKDNEYVPGAFVYENYNRQTVEHGTHSQKFPFSAVN